MKVILRENVDKVGKVGDVVEVKRGFAVNYLLPKALAAEVRPGIMQEVEARKRREARAQEERTKETRSLADQLSAASITLPMKVNPEGRLFGSVGPKEIAAALVADGFARVTEEMVVLTDPIKEPGVYEVDVNLGEDISAKCKVWIVPE